MALSLYDAYGTTHWLEANAWHSRTDALSTVAVLVGLVGAQFGHSWIDTVAAVVVAILVGKIGISLLWESSRELIDTALSEENQMAMYNVGRQVPGVRGFTTCEPVPWAEKSCSIYTSSFRQGFPFPRGMTSATRLVVVCVRTFLISCRLRFISIPGRHRSDLAFCFSRACHPKSHLLPVQEANAFCGSLPGERFHLARCFLAGCNADFSVRIRSSNASALFSPPISSGLSLRHYSVCSSRKALARMGWVRMLIPLQSCRESFFRIDRIDLASFKIQYTFDAFASFFDYKRLVSLYSMRTHRI